MNHKISTILFLTMFSLSTTAAYAENECMIGEIRAFAGNFAPKNWALAEGQMLPIENNSVLFSILSANYGGDGRETFALPDLRGRMIIGHDNRLDYSLKKGLGKLVGQAETVSPSDKARITENTDTLTETGSVIEDHAPGLVLNHIICMRGTYPGRNTESLID